MKLHLYLQLLPITCITSWAPPLVRSVVALDSHRNANPTVNCACEGSRLRAPYGNLMPDDLRWSWGGDASAGERLQIQIIISREVWLHRDYNKSIACRLIKTLSVSGKWQLSCILRSRLDISNTLWVSLSPITPRWDHLVAGKQAQGSHWFCIMVSCIIISLYIAMQ